MNTKDRWLVLVVALMAVPSVWVQVLLAVDAWKKWRRAK